MLFQHAELITKDDSIDWEGMIQHCKDNKLQWLALPQIGISKSGFVAYFFGQRKVIINPIIVKKTWTIVKSEELCASIPNETFTIDRAYMVLADVYDIEFKKHTMFIPYPHSIVFQHEYDHLNGILLNSK